ncbi:MAG: hypothetical protein B7Y39_03315, partial [Bdellovibrio sp. 28-41-41]
MKFLRWPLLNHFGVSLVLALILRILSAIYSYGPQSLDDYRHGLFPGLQMSEGQPLNMPGYRNQVLVWGVCAVLNLCKLLGITSHLSQLQWLYFIIGLVSLLSIVGIYLLFKNSESRLLPIAVLYVVALSPGLTFISTRILGESVGTSFLILACGCFYQHTRTLRLIWLISSCVFLGIATIFRFQIGIVYPLFIFFLLCSRQYRSAVWTIAVGFLILGVQAGIDVLSNRAPLETLWNYFIEFGTTPWYSTWLTIFGFALLPFSFGLWSALKRWWSQYWQLSVVVVFFTFVHSLIPHKEERFLFPLYPVVLVSLVYLWYYSRKKRAVKYIFVPFFLAFSMVALVFGVLSNSQESVVGPVARLKKTPQVPQIIVDISPQFGVFGLREFFIERNQKYLEVNSVAEININRSIELVVLTSKESYPFDIEKELASQHWDCESFQKFQSLSDQLVYSLSKSANMRRMPSWRSI